MVEKGWKVKVGRNVKIDFSHKLVVSFMCIEINHHDHDNDTVLPVVIVIHFRSTLTTSSLLDVLRFSFQSEQEDIPSFVQLPCNICPNKLFCSRCC